MNLPEDFLHSISSVIPSEEYDAFVKSLCEEEQTTSIRLNASKISREEAEAHFVNATKTHLAFLHKNDAPGKRRHQ